MLNWYYYLFKCKTCDELACGRRNLWWLRMSMSIYRNETASVIPFSLSHFSSSSSNIFRPIWSPSGAVLWRTSTTSSCSLPCSIPIMQTTTTTTTTTTSNPPSSLILWSPQPPVTLSKIRLVFSPSHKLHFLKL